MPRGIGVGTGYVSGQKSLRFGRVEMAEETIQTFVDAIATRASIDPAAAETAVGTILSVIQQEGDAAKVSQLFNYLPGAANLAQQHPVVVGSGSGVGGALSGLASKVMGSDAGIIVAALAQIEQTNLSIEQIKNIGSATLSYIKDANPALAKEVFDRIPGLQKHFA